MGIEQEIHQQLPRPIMIFVGFLLLLTFQLKAQVHISGVIKDPAGIPVTGCTVFLIDTSTLLLADNSLTDEQGRFAVSAEKNGVWEVKFRHIGFRDTSLIVTSPPQDPIFIDMTLIPLSYDLPSVTILDRWIGMKRSGDTLKYNINAYTNGNESVVGDILARLPGLQVTAQGDVLYLGKQIDHLLLDGNGLVGSEHHLVTQGLKSEVVDRVQLVENYTGDFGVKEDGAEQLALDVILKKKHQAKWLGKAELNVGLDWRYLGGLNLVRSGKKGGQTIYVKSTNTIVPGSTVGRQTVLEDIPKIPQLRQQSWDIVERELPWNIARQYFNVQDHQLTFIAQDKSRSALSFRSEISVDQSHFDHTSGQERQYLTDQSLDVLRFDRSTRPFRSAVRQDLGWRISDQTKLVAAVVAEHKSQKAMDVESGLLQDRNYDVRSELDQKQTSIRSGILLDAEIHENWGLKLFQGYNYHHADNEGILSATDTIFGAIFPDQTGSAGMDFSYEIFRHEFESGAQLTCDWKGAKLVAFTRGSWQIEDLHYATTIGSWSGKVSLNRGIFDAGLNISYPMGDLLLTGEATYNLAGTAFGSFRSNSRNLLWNLQAKWSVTAEEDLLLSARRDVIFPGLGYFNGLNMVIAPRQIEINELAPGSSLGQHNFTITYRKRPLAARSIFFTSAGISLSDGSYTVLPVAETGYTRGSAIILPTSWTGRTSFMWWYTSRHWQVLSSIMAHYSDGNTIAATSEEIPYRYLFSLTTASLRYKGFPNLEIWGKLSWNAQYQNTSAIRSSWHDLGSDLGIDLFRSYWTLKMNGGYVFTGLNRSSRNLLILNASVECRRWSPLVIGVKAFDLTNLNRSEISSVVLNPAGSILSIYRRIPGRVLWHMRWDF